MTGGVREKRATRKVERDKKTLAPSKGSGANTNVC